MNARSLGSKTVVVVIQLSGSIVDRIADYCLTYGWPSAFGGTERPITPATAIRGSTEGSAWKSVAAELEYVGSRKASAVEKPKRSDAPHAPNGRQLPKIIAASAMK